MDLYNITMMQLFENNIAQSQRKINVVKKLRDKLKFLGGIAYETQRRIVNSEGLKKPTQMRSLIHGCFLLLRLRHHESNLCWESILHCCPGGSNNKQHWSETNYMYRKYDILVVIGNGGAGFGIQSRILFEVI